MSLTGFNLFPEATSKYTNFEQIGDASSIADKGGLSYGEGFISGNSGSSRMQQRRINLGYIVDTVNGERITFQYNVIPKEQAGANYADHEAIGRSSPIPQYKGGKARQLDLPITFTMEQADRSDVLQKVRWLEGLVFPDYTDDNVVSLAPHPVVVVQGQLYSQDIWIVRDVTIEWGQALDPTTMLPESATVNLALTEVVLKGKSRNEVIRL